MSARRCISSPASTCPGSTGYLGRTQTALGAFYRRVAFRIGKATAITATARTLAILVDAQDRTCLVRRLRHRAEHLGFGLINLSTGEVVAESVS